MGVRCLVNLLNDAELRSLGLRCKYGEEVESAGLAYVQYPIVEGAGAADGLGALEAAHGVVQSVARVLEAGDSAVMHCRGGVGRAGMMGA